MSTAHLNYWPPNLPRSINFPERRVDENLRLSAKRDPTGRAIVFYGKEISWRDLDAAVDRIAAHLQHDCGIERGDRVILFSQNCPQFVIAYYAILRAGAVVVPINPMNRRGEVAHYISETQAKAAFCGQELIDEILPAVGQSSLRRIISIVYADFVLAHFDEVLPPSLTAARMSFDHPAVVDWQDASASMQAPEPIPFTSDEIAVLPFTSGSTGLPKGCVHTHETVMSTAVSGAVWEGLDANSIALVCTPLCHVTGMQLGMNRCVYAGATMVLMHRWTPQFAAALIERHGCTHWNAVPVMFVDVISHPEIEPAKLASLRVMSGGGAAMPQAMAQKIKDVYGVDFLEGYGMTESIAQTHLNPPNRPKNQCLGIPIFDVEAMVVDSQTGQPLPAGEVGEIVLRGPQVFKGYWNNPDATRAAFVSIDERLWYRSGDLGRVDDEGYFYFADRLKRMINAAGHKVWPVEVETMMYRHPSIRECCVVGTPDPRRGETVKAFIVLHPGSGPVDPDSIVKWAAANMAAYKVPRKIEFVAELPRGATGKIDWRTLQERENATAPADHPPR